MVTNAIYEGACLVFGGLLNTLTLGTYGNICVFSGDNEDYYTEVARLLGLPVVLTKWIVAIVNTLTLGVPSLALLIVHVVTSVIRAYKMERDLEIFTKKLEEIMRES